HGVNATGMRAAAAIPRQVRLSINRPVRLCWDEVEPADPGAGQELRVGEPARLQAVCVDRSVDVRAALAVGLVLIDHHDLAVWPDGRVTEVAAPVGGGDALRRAERAKLAQAGDAGAEGLHHR